MLKRIDLLPNWAITNKKPAFYDTESKTVIEETALVYAKMQDLINDYNVFVNEINETITSFTTSTNEDQECFKNEITTLIENYIKSIDTKISSQDLEIKKAINFMKTNLKQGITELIAEMHKNGEFDEAVLNAIDNIGNRVSTLERTEYTLEYEEGTENLILVKTVKEGE